MRCIDSDDDKAEGKWARRAWDPLPEGLGAESGCSGADEGDRSPELGARIATRLQHLPFLDAIRFMGAEWLMWLAGDVVQNLVKAGSVFVTAALLARLPGTVTVITRVVRFTPTANALTLFTFTFALAIAVGSTKPASHFTEIFPTPPVSAPVAPSVRGI